MVRRAARFGGDYSIETQLAKVKLVDEHIAPRTGLVSTFLHRLDRLLLAEIGGFGLPTTPQLDSKKSQFYITAMTYPPWRPPSHVIAVPLL